MDVSHAPHAQCSHACEIFGTSDAQNMYSTPRYTYMMYMSQRRSDLRSLIPVGALWCSSGGAVHEPAVCVINGAIPVAARETFFSHRQSKRSTLENPSTSHKKHVAARRLQRSLKSSLERTWRLSAIESFICRALSKIAEGVRWPHLILQPRNSVFHA